MSAVSEDSAQVRRFPPRDNGGPGGRHAGRSAGVQPVSLDERPHERWKLRRSTPAILPLPQRRAGAIGEDGKYEKRREYTRGRMVHLASYLVADSVESYCTDHIDDESIQAIFEPSEIDEGLAFRRSIPPDLMTLLQKWALGFVPLNTIERSLSDLIDARTSHPVQRTIGDVTIEGLTQLLQPRDVRIDCTGDVPCGIADAGRLADG